MSTESFTMYDNEFIVIFGVDHMKTGKAAYCSAAVYGEEYYNGVAGSNSMKWNDSAEEYLKGDLDVDKYFCLNLIAYEWLTRRGTNLYRTKEL